MTEHNHFQRREVKNEWKRLKNKLLWGHRRNSPKTQNGHNEPSGNSFVLAPEIKELSSERSISSSITKVIRNREWEESLREQRKDRFVHWNFTTILLTADEGENKKWEQLKNEWIDMIIKTAEENKLKAERLSKIWEKDIYSIRRSIQETVIPSGTRRIPKTLEEMTYLKFKTGKNNFWNTYVLEGKTYLQFLRDQQNWLKR